MTQPTSTLTTEQDRRLRLLEKLCISAAGAPAAPAGRALAEIHPLHAEEAACDPCFYVRLAAWYCDHWPVPDHRAMFIATLCMSENQGHREVGLALLNDFDEEPADSALCAMRRLTTATTPVEQTQAIIDHAIPYRVAASVLRQMTPTVLLTLIERMTPAEALESMASLTRRGVMDNAYLKGRIERKVRQADVVAATTACPQTRALDLLAEILDYPLPASATT